MAGSTNFPTSFDSLGSVVDNQDDVVADHVNDLRRTVEAIEAKLGIDSSSVDTSIDYKVNNFFVENTTTLWFYQAAAPTGWTIQDVGDKLLAVGKADHEYDSTTGGSSTDDWTISGLEHNHQWLSEIANATSHNQSYDTDGVLTNPTMGLKNAGIFGPTGSLSVNHTYNVRDDLFTTKENSASDGSWRPSAFVGILGKYTGS